MSSRVLAAAGALAALTAPALAGDRAARSDLDALIARHARQHAIPEALVHRVIKRESGYNPQARHGGNWGLMQIKHGTARTMGYSGLPGGLLDPDTNLTYGVRYLAEAYRVAGGNQDRAVALYMRGYYRQAKDRETRRQGLARATAAPLVAAEAAENRSSTAAEASRSEAWPLFQPTFAAEWRLLSR